MKNLPSRTAGAQMLRDAVPDTARGSNYEDFHFSSPDVTALAYVRGNAIGFFTSTSWSRAGIEAARHYVRAAVNTSRERTKSKTLLGAAVSWTTPLDCRTAVSTRQLTNGVWDCLVPVSTAVPTAPG